MKYVVAAIGAILLIGAGVGGTLGVQAIYDGERSEACEIAADWADDYVVGVHKDSENRTVNDWLKESELINGLYNIREKACR